MLSAFKYAMPVMLALGINTALLAQNTIKKSQSDQTMKVKRVEWRHHTNVYEVNVRQYTPEGTFKAFQQQIPRLKEMGVHTLWFMPVTPISQKNKKGSLGSYYAAHDYVSVNPEFGTIDDFRELVRFAHSQGMKVIIDWVANHTGWDHVWTTSHPDFYIRNSKGEFTEKNGWDDVIDLNYANGDMRKAMVEAMKFWVRETDIDGFRCDMAMLVPLDFWMEARPQLDAVKPLYWLAELDQMDNPEYLQVFDASYSWSWMHKAKDYYQQKREVNSLDSVLMRYSMLQPKEAIRAFFTTNHDENSWNGTEYEKYGEMAQALAVFAATYEGTPLIYSGQELPNKKRLKFFDKDPIEWAGTPQLHDFYKKLLTLHSTHPALAAGDANVKLNRVMVENDQHSLSFTRTKDNKQVFVTLNLSPYPATLKFKELALKGEFKELFSERSHSWKGQVEVSLPAWGYAVYYK